MIFAINQICKYKIHICFKKICVAAPGVCGRGKHRPLYSMLDPRYLASLPPLSTGRKFSITHNSPCTTDSEKAMRWPSG